MCGEVVCACTRACGRARVCWEEGYDAYMRGCARACVYLTWSTVPPSSLTRKARPTPTQPYSNTAAKNSPLSVNSPTDRSGPGSPAGPHGSWFTAATLPPCPAAGVQARSGRW